jgi:hypothetical protein
MLLHVPSTVAELRVLLSFAVVGVGAGFAMPAMMIASRMRYRWDVSGQVWDWRRCFAS